MVKINGANEIIEPKINKKKNNNNKIILYIR